MPHFFRKPCGPGWALVGDAGCHKDPILALGVCEAFRDAELLADAVDEGLSGRRAMGDALRDYEQRRNEVSMAEYRENLHLARFQPFPEETYRLRAALREDPDATRQFFLARQGMIPRESFFNTDNLQHLMALCCLLMLLLWPCSAPAQARLTGTDVTGRVVDATGAVLADATVTVINEETSVTRVVRTDARGQFQAPALPPGTYQIAVERSGFTPQVLDGITLQLGQSSRTSAR